MILSPEDRRIIDSLKENYSINISQAFRQFLKGMLNKLSHGKINA